MSVLLYYNNYNNCEELTHWKRPWCWERLKEGGEGDDRGWDGWMASPTWCTWVWVNSGSWWWTGRPGVLWFMGRKESDTTEWLNWTEYSTLGFPGGSLLKKLPPNVESFYILVDCTEITCESYSLLFEMPPWGDWICILIFFFFLKQRRQKAPNAQYRECPWIN